MRARAFIRRITAAALVPLVLLVGLSTAHALYRCGGSKVLRSSCCCPKARAQADTPDTGARLKNAFCCSIERTAPVQSPTAQLSERDAGAASLLRPLVFPVALIVPLVAADVARLPERGRELLPPRPTASLFRQRIALLV